MNEESLKVKNINHRTTLSISLLCIFHCESKENIQYAIKRIKMAKSNYISRFTIQSVKNKILTYGENRASVGTTKISRPPPEQQGDSSKASVPVIDAW